MASREVRVVRDPRGSTQGVWKGASLRFSLVFFKVAVQKLSPRDTSRGAPTTSPRTPRGRGGVCVMFPDAHGMTPSPPSRTFEQYRYAIEAGLISPHDVRCYVPAWERSPATEATTAGTRARAGKRYHDSEDDYAETVEDDDENQGIARCVLHPRSEPVRRVRRVPSPTSSRRVVAFFEVAPPNLWLLLIHLPSPALARRREASRRRFRRILRPIPPNELNGR